MSASVNEVWGERGEASASRFGSRVGVLLFMASAVVSVKGLAWLVSILIGVIMQ